MRQELLERLKSDIVNNLSAYLRSEGYRLAVAANDNAPPYNETVILEMVEDITLHSTKLLSEIRIILSILGKPWQCEALIEGIYQCLQPHYLTLPELTVLLMSIHVDSTRRMRFQRPYTRATLRYVMEEEIREEECVP